MNEFLLEKKRLETALGEKIAGGRQHYLRFRAPETWRQWEKAGFSYDSTMTYAEHEGFRCGTCHPFHPFDIERDQEFKISEVPLVIMDGTLWQYRKLSMNEAKSRIMDLAGRCKQAEGTFTLLWHNSSFEGEWASWTTQYPQLLDQLRTL